MLYCGFDFGTSNTVVTVIDDEGSTKALIADPSVLFLPDCGALAQQRYVGARAIERYVASSMDGRFIQSIKSVLPDSAFHHTEIFGKIYSAVELVSMILNHFKERLEREVGEPVENAVFGRPVVFSRESADDDLAENRLRQAAEKCGFKSIVFEYEPVGAATKFAQTIGTVPAAFVCDFGGGTADFSVIRRAPDGGIDIAANLGVRVGGDDFDGEIMWNKLINYFGYGTKYESYGKMLPVPVHIYRTLMRWDRIPFLKTLEYREDLRYIHSGAEDRIAIEWLLKLIDEDLGFALFDSIRSAKHELSANDRASIAFFERGIEFKEPLYLDEFSEFIGDHLDTVEETVKRVLETAGGIERCISEIGVLFLTGGSSLVRSIQERMATIFSNAEIRVDNERFNSVSSGLAMIARERNHAIS